MKLRSEKDFWSGLLFMAAGSAFAVASLGQSFGTRTAPGPGFFPFAGGVLTALIGAALLFKSLALETEGGERIGPWHFMSMLLLAGGMVCFAWTLPQLGLVVAVSGLVLFVALAVGGARIGTLAGQLLLLSGVAYGLQVWLSGESIPLWK